MAALVCAMIFFGGNGSKIVGKNIKINDINDFYYTLDVSTNPPYFQRYRFYKEEGYWYADIPAHTKEENEMVDGADLLLDTLAGSLCDEITLTITNGIGLFRRGEIVLQRKSHDEIGADYEIIDGRYAKAHALIGCRCWLCNVVHTLFHEHPERLVIFF